MTWPTVATLTGQFNFRGWQLGRVKVVVEPGDIQERQAVSDRQLSVQRALHPDVSTVRIRFGNNDANDCAPDTGSVDCALR